MWTMSKSTSTSRRGGDLRSCVIRTFNQGVSCIFPIVLYVIDEYVVITELDAKAMFQDGAEVSHIFLQTKCMWGVKSSAIRISEPLSLKPFSRTWILARIYINFIITGRERSSWRLPSLWHLSICGQFIFSSFEKNCDMLDNNAPLTPSASSKKPYKMKLFLRERFSKWSFLETSLSTTAVSDFSLADIFLLDAPELTELVRGWCFKCSHMRP